MDLDREEAKSIFREVWKQYALATGDRCGELDKVLDAIQTSIMREPAYIGDPEPLREWNEFTESIPGYNEYWKARIEYLTSLLTK